MWKAIAIIALTLGLEAGFLLNAAVPARPVGAEAQQALLVSRCAEQARELARVQGPAARPPRC